MASLESAVHNTHILFSAFACKVTNILLSLSMSEEAFWSRLTGSLEIYLRAREWLK